MESSPAYIRRVGALIEKYLNNTISVQQFGREYIDIFLKKNTAPLEKDLFLTLDWLFAEVDCYTDDRDLIAQDPKWHISEDQLRVSAQKVLDDLKNM